MFYDRELYDNAILHSNYLDWKIQPSLVPIVIKSTNLVYVSNVEAYENNTMYESFESKRKVHRIEIRINNKVIKEHDVIDYSLFFPETKGSSVYILSSNDKGTIFEQDDFEDYILIIKKINSMTALQSSSYDYVLYKNCDLIHTIYNAKRIVVTDRKIDTSNIVFLRSYNDANGVIWHKNWLFSNGKEKSEDELNLTLPAWDKLFGHGNSLFSLSMLYSKNNELPLDSPSLSWNSPASANWACPFGHNWKEKVCFYTCGEFEHKIEQHNYCPECSDYLRDTLFYLSYEEGRRYINLFKKAFSMFNTKNLKSLHNMVEMEFNRLLKLAGEGITWIDLEKMPSVVEYYLLYPNGKHGDIDRFISEEYGFIFQIDEFLYKAVIPTENADAIELYSESYVSIDYDKHRELLRNDQFDEFLVRYNSWFRLRFLSSVVRHLQGVDLNNVYEFDRRMTKYRSSIREKRKLLYNKAVLESKATRKWISEQTLFRFVKSLYPDAVFQFTAEWLGLQSIDVFIPSINVGIEYQGKQHYDPIQLFGGEEGLKRRRELDIEKRNKCRMHGVKLLEWKYDIAINKESVEEFLKSI